MALPQGADPQPLGDAVAAAAATIAKDLPPTPLLHSPSLSAQLGCKVLLKMESMQPTGSFKVRGAFTKYHHSIAHLPSDSDISFVAASSGNHALACCFCWTRYNRVGRIFVPGTVSSDKEAKLRALGFPVVKVPGQCLDSELAARRFADESPTRVLVPPYNDWAVMSGNGTMAAEALAQVEERGDSLDAMFISVGGGGLIGGSAAFLKSRAPLVRVIGAQPKNDPVMSRSVRQGCVMTSEELRTTDTIAEGVAGGLEDGTITFDPCRSFVDDWIECSEHEIARATLRLLETDDIKVEAAAGLALAALCRCSSQLQGRKVVVCICGGNTGDAQWSQYQKVAGETSD